MLKFNEQTKVIFADDAPGVTYPVREIAEADIAGLVANGATVDASVAVAEAGSAAAGEALPSGAPADSGTNPVLSDASTSEASTQPVPNVSGSTGAEQSITTVEAGNVVAPTAKEIDSSVGAALFSNPSESLSDASLPRESHLLLLEHKLAAMHAKFMTGERIVIDEFEQILGHIRAVL